MNTVNLSFHPMTEKPAPIHSYYLLLNTTGDYYWITVGYWDIPLSVVLEKDLTELTDDMYCWCIDDKYTPASDAELKIVVGWTEHVVKNGGKRK